MSRLDKLVRHDRLKKVKKSKFLLIDLNVAQTTILSVCNLKRLVHLSCTLTIERFID